MYRSTRMTRNFWSHFESRGSGGERKLNLTLVEIEKCQNYAMKASFLNFKR